MQSLDPLSFNGIRFALGAVFIWLVAGKTSQKSQPFPLLPGLVLFVAATLQQIGMVYTTAGAAGFITGLYIVLVPVLGLLKGHRLSPLLLGAVLLSLSGMYLLNQPGDLKAGFGNLLVLGSAVFWAIHVQLIDSYAKKFPAVHLAFSQYAVCALLSLLGFGLSSLIHAPVYLFSAAFANHLQSALLPLLYGGIMSVGVAYSLQVKAQQKASPTGAAIILCLEGVFALFGGWLILHENLSGRSLLGAGLMLAAMLISVLPKFLIDRNRA